MEIIHSDGAVCLQTNEAENKVVVLRLGERGTVASSGPTPYGFALTSGGTLVVTEAFGARKGAAAASSYLVRGGEMTPVTTSVGNGRSEICWRSSPETAASSSRPTSPTERCPARRRGRREPDPRRRHRGVHGRRPARDRATRPSPPTAAISTPSTPTRVPSSDGPSVTTDPSRPSVRWVAWPPPPPGSRPGNDLVQLRPVYRGTFAPVSELVWPVGEPAGG